MKHRGRLAILFIPATLIVVIVIVVKLMRQNEGPRFEGRTLHSWMQDLEPYVGSSLTVRGPTVINGVPTLAPWAIANLLHPDIQQRENGVDSSGFDASRSDKQYR